MKKIKSISIDAPAGKMPRWALLQRQFIDLANQSASMLKPYLSEEGAIIWPESVKDFQTFAYGNVDNAFEGFQSWPLFYLLGGDDSYLKLAHQSYNALTRQFSSLKKRHLGIAADQAEKLGRDTLLVDEWYPDLDWMHQGEAAMFLYYLCLADPQNSQNKERVLKITNYLIGENPAGFERNYDPVHKVFKSSYFGTNGPAWAKFHKPISHSNWMDFYGLAFYDVPGVTTLYDLAQPEKAKAYGRIYGQRMATSDTVTNMMATSMALNAYFYTGKQEYKDFILEYVGGWRERYAGNRGIMPDNAGPSGRVGENMQGRWYGGHYGWVHPHGFWFIGDAMIIGGENEKLLTGRSGALDWLRDQLLHLSRYGVTGPDGTRLLPQKHTDKDAVIEYIGDENTPMTRPDRVTDYPGLVRYRQVDGWYEFSPTARHQLSHLYLDSFSKADLDLARSLSKPDFWHKVSPDAIMSKYKGGQDSAYLNYLSGTYPDYPEDVLSHSIDLIYKQYEILAAEQSSGETAFGYAPDNTKEETELSLITKELNEKHGLAFSESTVHSYYQTFILYRNPLSLEALVHLTMGGSMPVYNGGLFNVSLRYFDDRAKRPGLPPDVAALISQISSDQISLTLCNLNPGQSRSLILQGGAYGEHQLLSINWGTKTSAIDNRWLRLELAPATRLDCQIKLARNHYQPSFCQPY